MEDAPSPPEFFSTDLFSTGRAALGGLAAPLLPPEVGPAPASGARVISYAAHLHTKTRLPPLPSAFLSEFCANGVRSS